MKQTETGGNGGPHSRLLVRNQEVEGSNPSRSTNLQPTQTDDLAGGSQGATCRWVALAVLCSLSATACGSSLSVLGPSDTVSRSQEEHMKLGTVVLAGALVSGTVRGAEPKAPNGEPSGECQMHVDFDEQAGLLRAAYDTPTLCYPQDELEADWMPAWVQVDMQELQLGMEVSVAPSSKPTGSNRGYFMRPIGPAGTYQIQARSGYNNGRDTRTVTVARDGSVTVQQ